MASNVSQYYWLRPGAYFKYRLTVSPPEKIIIHDKINDVKYVADPSSSSIFFYWEIVNVEKNFFIARIGINASNVLNEKTNTFTNYTFTEEFMVKIDTLDTYSITSDGRRGAWVGEWPYLLQPILTSKKGVKLLYFSDGDICLVGVNETDFIRDVKRINETVYRISNGTRTYSPIPSSGVEVERSGSSESSSAFCISNWTAIFAFINPPPASSQYNLSGIVLGAERIASSPKIKFISYNGEDVPLFNTLYNNSKRGLIVDSICKYNNVLIDPMGRVYAVMIVSVQVMYDSITGVLLKAHSPEEPLFVLPFPCLWEKIQITYKQIVPKPADFTIELIETNINFSRPIIGGTESLPETTAPQRSRGTSSGTIWVIVIGITVIAALTFVFYLKQLRKRHI